MVKYLITVLILTIVLLLVLLCRQQKKIQISNKIRVGYEEKCNIFRIKYTVLSKLEDRDDIREKVRQLDKPVYLFGGGVHGERFRKILEKDERIQLLRTLESNELKAQIGQENILRQDAAVIVTPMFDYDNIVKLLLNFVTKECIIGIDEFI